MAYIVLIIVLAVVALLLYQSVQDARRRAEGGTPAQRQRPAPRRPAPKAKPKPKPKPRPRKAKVDEAALAAHVAKLRAAIDDDLISMDEAVASIVRQTDGALGEEAARKLLGQGSSG